MGVKVLAMFVGVALFTPAAPVKAHHAFAAEFDANQPIELRGTLTKVEWVNPHSWLYLEVKGPDGKVVTWALELGPPNALFRRGWTKDTVQSGAELLVRGFRAKSGKAVANARDVVFPDGRELFAGSSGTGAPDGR
jgi:hypothetical protein